RAAPAAGAGGRAQRVVQDGLAVDGGGEGRAVHGQLQVVPHRRVERQLALVGALHETAQAVVELPEHDVVLGVVVADGQPVAVRLDVEDDAGAAVQLPAHGLELHGDAAV